jgi:small nuclear ribonucleoprotein E
MEGRIIGFDEYMNLVLDEAEEVSVKRKTRKFLGRILLKGDCITLMQTVGTKGAATS